MLLLFEWQRTKQVLIRNLVLLYLNSLDSMIVTSYANFLFYGYAIFDKGVSFQRNSFYCVGVKRKSLVCVLVLLPDLTTIQRLLGLCF